MEIEKFGDVIKQLVIREEIIRVKEKWSFT